MADKRINRIEEILPFIDLQMMFNSQEVNELRYDDDSALTALGNHMVSTAVWFK